jgi:hypothetical protein
MPGREPEQVWETRRRNGPGDERQTGADGESPGHRLEEAHGDVLRDPPREGQATGLQDRPEGRPGAETGPLPLGVARTPTGNAEIDAHLDRLADADHLPAEGHIEVYEDVHRGLREVLTALDARPGPPPPTPSVPPDNRS